MPQSPAAFVADALLALERSVRDHGSDLRNVQLATVSADGAPEVRTMVLRDFGRSPDRLETHTDLRAAKALAIGGAGPVALLAWSAADRLQLRFAGTARLHGGDAVARERWDALSPRARSAYGTVAVPGTAIPDPADRPLLPPEEQYRQFGVLLVMPETVDVLRLEAEGGQTRARARFATDGLRADWIGA